MVITVVYILTTTLVHTTGNICYSDQLKCRSIVIVICYNSGLQGPTFLVIDPVRINEPRVHVDDHNTKVSPLNTA